MIQHVNDTIEFVAKQVKEKNKRVLIPGFFKNDPRCAKTGHQLGYGFAKAQWADNFWGVNGQFNFKSNPTTGKPVERVCDEYQNFI